MSTSLEQKLTHLKLSRIREVYPTWIRHAEQHQLGYGEFLEEVLSEELLSRQENQIRRKLKLAGFPFAATLEQFNFTLRPELKRAVIMRFFDSSFVEKAGALLLIGASGLGKTHLAIALGTQMVQLGYTVRFLTAQQLANSVLAAPTGKRTVCRSAPPTPSAPPPRLIIELAIRECLNKAAVEAPSAWRTAISRRLRTPRINRSPARFAQAIRRTTMPAPTRTRTSGRALATTLSSSGTSEARTVTPILAG